MKLTVGVKWYKDRDITPMFMMLCVLNWINVGYIVNNDNIYVERGVLDKKSIETAASFIRLRLKDIVSVDFADKSKRFKEKTDKAVYDQKVNTKKVKDTLAVV